MAVIAIMPTPAIQSAAFESAPRKRAMPCRRCCIGPLPKGAGGRRTAPRPVAYSVAWMSSTSFFISGVAAYFS